MPTIETAAVAACAFAALFAGHQLGDHLVQPDAAAQHKGHPTDDQLAAGVHPWTGWLACARHVATYILTQALALALISLVAPLTLAGAAAALAASASTHAVIDRRWIVRLMIQAKGCQDWREAPYLLDLLCTNAVLVAALLVIGSTVAARSRLVALRRHPSVDSKIISGAFGQNIYYLASRPSYPGDLDIFGRSEEGKSFGFANALVESRHSLIRGRQVFSAATCNESVEPETSLRYVGQPRLEAVLGNHFLVKLPWYGSCGGWVAVGQQKQVFESTAVCLGQLVTAPSLRFDAGTPTVTNSGSDQGNNRTCDAAKESYNSCRHQTSSGHTRSTWLTGRASSKARPLYIGRCLLLRTNRPPRPCCSSASWSGGLMRDRRQPQLDRAGACDRMAATADAEARGALLDDLYDAVVDVVGGQAAEAVHCLPAPGHRRARTLRQIIAEARGRGAGRGLVSNPRAAEDGRHE